MFFPSIFGCFFWVLGLGDGCTVYGTIERKSAKERWVGVSESATAPTAPTASASAPAPKSPRTERVNE